MEALLESKYRKVFPKQLIDHLTAAELQEIPVEYKLPEIIDNRKEPIKDPDTRTSPSQVRLPARLESALIPYPESLTKSILSGDVSKCKGLHAHHRTQLSIIEDVVAKLQLSGDVPTAPIVFDMDSLKRLARQKYSHREQLIMAAAKSFAIRATQQDLSVAATVNLPHDVVSSKNSSYTPFIIMIQRLRTHISKQEKFVTFEGRSETNYEPEASYTMFLNGVYHYRSTFKGNTFHIISCIGHFRFYHENLGYWFAGPNSYLDYLFTLSDVLNNLDMLRCCEEYSWANKTFGLMVNFAEHEGHHENQVEFMKGLEGLYLTMSDYDEGFAMNWKPILETTVDLWKLDKKISGIEYDYGLVLALMTRKQSYYPPKSFLCKFIVSSHDLTRTQCQEISALHKLIFYAEVNARAGVEKFLKRVHSPRKVDANAVSNLTRLAKQIFLVSYRKKHGTIPNLIGPVPKIKLLELYSRTSDMKKIELLPLDWWDEIKIHNCMDNTKTLDPLEFAKDKAAIKREIKYGTGDSRKELLQVIERDGYVLKDFFKSRNIVPLPSKVQKLTKSEIAELVAYAARLSEKGREQKLEARLFGTAQLEDKHSLSVVASKIKDALSYFDEQLMTPTDRVRKGLLHDAARDLSKSTNYSLLLDIEGHNQSMQAINTSELSEFIGGLFGEEGWESLASYFSMLNVYHYDEYIDDVIHSTGQLGGIEGWLNPFWTLHTTLMMKLLRYMTDLTVNKIMVYSDDVNAIVSIPQASEPMVQSVFLKIMDHCSKFGMKIKYSQTTLSKHRTTMLRQHYADGVRADSTLKRLLSVSSCNNSKLAADELEVSGICSSSSSAMELSNHSESCCFLKNYKLGLLLVRLPHMVLSMPEENSMISEEELPKKLCNLIYYVKQDAAQMSITTEPEIIAAAVNDVAAYFGRNINSMSGDLLKRALEGVYGQKLAHERFVDNADRLIYLQVYDDFVKDLLFFWTYLPTSLGGLGASLHINLALSGHSVGVTKSLHYLKQWIEDCAVEKEYFRKYMSTVLSVDMENSRNTSEARLATSNWPSDAVVTSVSSRVQSAIKFMVRKKSKNSDVNKLFELSDESGDLAQEFVNIFRSNFHSRVVQFYFENTSAHFVDLLLNKVETSSGLLSEVQNINRLRRSCSGAAVWNIRFASKTNRTYFFTLDENSDIVDALSTRKSTMFPKVEFVKVEEVLYDDKIMEVDREDSLLTVRMCSATHFRDGIKVYDDPKVGNETRYKGELIDTERIFGNKEEFLSAKLVSVTKWFLTKSGLVVDLGKDLLSTDAVKACNLALSTLTTRRFTDLVNYAPTETGGEILHRIPNIRFSTTTYIRPEMNRSLKYTTDLNQGMMTAMDLVDSNVNVDYLRMRFLLASIMMDKRDSTRRSVVRYTFSNLTGIIDVQFLKPEVTDYEVGKVFQCYGAMKNHDLSLLKFRYLANTFMYEENMSEWATMPTFHEELTAQQVGDSFINDTILRYSRDLDKDFLLVKPTLIDKDMWKPLIDKLDSIDKRWRGIVKRNPVEVIRERLMTVMAERGRLTLLRPTDRVVLELQKQCLENLHELNGTDDVVNVMIDQYSSMSRSKLNQSSMDDKLRRFRFTLEKFESKRKMMALNLITEYILTFHFKVKREPGNVKYSVYESLEEFYSSGIGLLTHMTIAPDLQFSLLVLGHGFVRGVASEMKSEITETLLDVSDSLSMADIVMPGNLPSLGSHTLLTGEEEVPKHLSNISYLVAPLPLSSMSDIKDLAPLARFAHKCSTSGADPRVFTSFTGSDSLGAQVGLFRELMNRGWVYEDMSICDLTAGRGDGKYAMTSLGLNCDSYSKKDTFTRLNHHPGITYMESYDVFDGSTLKFVTGYDHVHIDISFAGNAERNILDTLLLLEESRVQYTVRMNSVQLDGYNQERLGDSVTYDHYLAYAGSSTLKPYQIYLIGRPVEFLRTWDETRFRDTMAFRSMAISFTKLLSPNSHFLRMHEYEPNSVSLQIPRDRELRKYIKSLAEDSLAIEQKYYLTRYISEVDTGASICVVRDKSSKLTKQVLQNNSRLFVKTDELKYGAVNGSNVGNVSDKSRRYHEAHAESLSDPTSKKLSVPILKCSNDMLEHFRIHHPLQDVRTWCNIMLGLRTYCLGEVISGHSSLMSLASKLRVGGETKLSLHQREIMLAMKLHLIAAVKNDSSYGVNHCREISVRQESRSKSMDRVLKIYRLSSYLFEEFKSFISSGSVTLSCLNSVVSSVEVRENLKYKYVRDKQEITEPFLHERLVGDIIDGSISKLFGGFNKYGKYLTDQMLKERGLKPMNESFTENKQFYDIKVENVVNEAINRLAVKPSGIHNYIELYGSDESEGEDWV